MPKQDYPYPYGKPHRMAATEPLTIEQLSPLLAGSATGITLEVLVADVGAGYLFHIRRIAEGYELKSYTGETLTSFADMQALCRFINHASGIEFDEESWGLGEDLNGKFEEEEEDNQALGAED